MALPKFNDLYIPILQILSNKGGQTPKEISNILREYYNLSDEEYNSVTLKGNNIFYGRVGWSLSDLYRSQLLEKPQPRRYQLSSKGKKMLRSPEGIEAYVFQSIKELGGSRGKNTDQDNPKVKQPSNLSTTPDELLEQAYHEIRNECIQRILDELQRTNPYQFERLTLQALKAMGYGGSIKDALKQTKLSKDGGIDGIIKEDVLGLGHIYIQAKRYAAKNNIGRQDIQGFVGALMGAQSNKGIFITTSDFSKDAKEYAEKLSNYSIVLINGIQLAEYMYEYNIGVQRERVYEVKKLDLDFWDEYTENQ